MDGGVYVSAGRERNLFEILERRLEQQRQQNGRQHDEEVLVNVELTNGNGKRLPRETNIYIEKLTNEIIKMTLKC